MEDFLIYGLYPFCAIFGVICLYSIALTLEKIANKK